MKEQLEKLMVEEYNRAKKIHGGRFNSPHEAFGIILEEIYEASTDIKEIKEYSDDLFTKIRYNEDIGHELHKIKKSAIHGAFELIQVAAMCHKATMGFVIEDIVCNSGVEKNNNTYKTNEGKTTHVSGIEFCIDDFESEIELYDWIRKSLFPNNKKHEKTELKKFDISETG